MREGLLVLLLSVTVSGIGK